MKMVTEFWSVWMDEYVRNLPPYKGNAQSRDLKVGSVVLIEGEGNRIDWPLGLVHSIHPGRDGLSRAITLRTQKGLITRPIQRLHDLELLALASDQDPDQNLSSSASSSTPPFPYPCGSDTGTAKAHTANNDQKCASANNVPQTTTRYGRTVRKPQNPDFMYDDYD